MRNLGEKERGGKREREVRDQRGQWERERLIDRARERERPREGVTETGRG